jgi:hypothetical protein
MNFRVRVPGGSSAGSSAGSSGGGGGGSGGGAPGPLAAAPAFVLKIHNAADTACGLGLIEAQHALMQWAACSGIPTNRAIPLAVAAAAAAVASRGDERDSSAGGARSSARGSSGDAGRGSCARVTGCSGDGCIAAVELYGQRHAVRMLTFVEGAVIGQQRLVRAGTAAGAWGAHSMPAVWVGFCLVYLWAWQPPRPTALAPLLMPSFLPAGTQAAAGAGQLCGAPGGGLERWAPPRYQAALCSDPIPGDS